MITIRKLTTLAAGTRRRKLVRLLEGWERGTLSFTTSYLCDLARLVQTDAELPDHVRDAAAAVVASPDHATTTRAVNALRHALATELGATPADWDLLEPAGLPARLSPDRPTVATAVSAGPLAGVMLYLEAIRSPFNAGSIIRTAAAFGVARVWLSPECPASDHPRLLRSAMGSERLVPVSRAPLDEALDRSGDALPDGPPDAPPALIALELGGAPVASFDFPARGVLLLGSEELGLSAELLDRADARVSIPMAGSKASLNVGVACGIALAFWSAARTAAVP